MASSDFHAAREARLAKLGLRLEDFEETFARSSGPGGQHVNKVSTAVTLRHGPTGKMVTAQDSRSQSANRQLAWTRLLDAIERARKEQVPTLLEVRTYRFMGHSMSDAVSGTYRPKSELEEQMKRDPITLLRTHMQEAGQLTDEQLQKMDEEIKAVVQDAWDFADASPELPPEALYEDVYADSHT